MKNLLSKVLSFGLKCHVGTDYDYEVFRGFTLVGNHIRDIHLMDNMTGEIFRPWRISYAISCLNWQNCEAMYSEVLF